MRDGEMVWRVVVTFENLEAKGVWFFLWFHSNYGRKTGRTVDMHALLEIRLFRRIP